MVSCRSDALDHSHAHAALARAPTHGRNWACLSGKIQIVSGSVQTDEHFLTVARYVERNALRANLVQRAEEWRWSSLFQFVHRGTKFFDMINHWPVERPPDWIEFVNGTERKSELEDLRLAAQRGRPFGAKDWMMKTAEQLGLISSLHPRGRPKVA